MPHLVVIYGAPFTGKSSVAREVAGMLGAGTALVSVDALLGESIVVAGPDVVPELEMVHTQARLLVANYLKNGYHVVVEGAYYYERDGVLHRHEQEIDQLISLMRNLARAPLIAGLSASMKTLHQRAADCGRPGEVETALRIAEAYKPRYGNRVISVATDEGQISHVAAQIVSRLEAVDIA